MSRPDSRDLVLSRRSACVRGLGAFGLAMRCGIAQAQEPRAEDDIIAAVEKRFADAGIPKPAVTRMGRFQAIGTARPDFARRVLKLAEDTAIGYFRFFTGIRLPATPGNDPLIVVILANAGQYSRFNGENKARNEGGHYDIDANWTVTFDHRGRSRSTRSDLERANQVTMIHEIAHQLSFNSGLLSREADIPMLISEGLATMAEPGGASILPGFSEVNQPRLAVMEQLSKSKKARWIPLTDLVATDDPFDAPDDATVQFAYSQAWLFWDTVVRQTRLREKLGPYLERVNSRRNPAKRMEDFVAAFGSIRAVEEAMAANLKSLTSG